MALSPLIKFAYNHGTEEVIRRGKKVHAIGFAELTDHDPLMHSAVFRVRDDVYHTFYRVYIQKYNDEQLLNVRCSCPYNLGDICRHEVAALFQLQDLIDKHVIGLKDQLYDQRHTIAKMKTIDLKTIRMLASKDSVNDAEQFLRTNKASILQAKNDQVKAELTLNGQQWTVIIQKNEERNFDTSCGCAETDYPLCEHKTIVFLQLLHTYGPSYFDSIRDQEKEKAKLLGIYGYSLQDAWQEKFEFIYKDGKPFLRVLDPKVKRLEQNIQTKQVSQNLTVPTTIKKEKTKLRLGVVLNMQNNRFPFFTVDAIKGEAEEETGSFTGKLEKLDISKYVEGEDLHEEDLALLPLIRKLQPAEINKFVNRNSPFASIWGHITGHEEEEITEDTRQLIIDYLLPRLLKLFSEPNLHIFILHKGKQYITKNLKEVQASTASLYPQFELRKNQSNWEWRLFVKMNGAIISLEENECTSPLILCINGELRTWSKVEDAALVANYAEKGNKEISRKQLAGFIEKEAILVARKYPVQFDPSLISEVKEGSPEIKLQLQEQGEYLLLQPHFSYKGHTIKATDPPEILLVENEKLFIVKRNLHAEQEFLAKIENLHSQFIRMGEGRALALRGSEVLRNNWFFLFVDAMKDMKITVEGWEVLKNFRFNTAKPKTQIYISNGVDWFDARVDIVFGDQQVTISELKKALQNQQSFVQLPDGTLGVLPDEWIKKYSLLFRIGENKQEKLRLSKYHISIIDELYENRDENEIQIELEEKYEKLREFKRIREIQAPENLRTILRPYQKSGFEWLNFLNEVGWGGILADDMGLGKTIQALSFLQYLREKNGSLFALVVCPTTLMYNWENELKKFTPSLTYHIHHGSQRANNFNLLKQYEVVITTYGTMRSDIRLFTELTFDSIILDESQAIKNPQSKVAKASVLLKGKHRLCMSGTPLQNNTFDVYAQMNFLNPGMLGSVEHFRNDFATPIDKFGEQEQKDHLRRLLYPFILRRTKEQVAKDLPEKTETILYCEMNADQRKIYDAYRNEYRSRILGTIDEVGISGSQLTILQGLMKLRQICDSPYILNEEEKLPNVSIKLDELTRELKENISSHKTLVFSQFLGMLALIREKLEEEGISYVYFDGSTSAADREKAVRNFQEDESIRVFLISLKAGGVGLNLTAASYVFIVDPWWNPAVEQQAIDRTHRIGQTNNIFAYRMICKDTIEDKIIILQEKKRALAKDLISDDTGFIKSLSREDVEYLFS
jgi:non-specific serine/threonine protein kinase